MYQNVSGLYNYESLRILNLLFKMTKQIEVISEEAALLMKKSNFVLTNAFELFLDNFGRGNYYHYRCQGYMEALVITKCFAPIAFCYWNNNLLIPADENYAKAIMSFKLSAQKVPEYLKEDYDRIEQTICAFEVITEQIKSMVEKYPVDCTKIKTKPLG